MTGLDDAELAQHDGQALPAREQMSLMSTGGLGLVDSGATGTETATETGTESGSGSLLAGDGLPADTSATGSTDPDASASTADPYTSTADGYDDDAQQDLAQTAQSDDDGAYSPNESAVASS